MTPTEQAALLAALKQRFTLYPARHVGIGWNDVAARLQAHPDALSRLQAMEASGGEPDLIDIDEGSGALVYVDCAAESPSGRRSLCYDRAALDARKQNKPSGSALELAAAMGIALLDEAQYRALQQLGEFDRKTSSWIVTPPAIRKLGGALFGDRRYNRVFTYHNGAESYYAARGFRGRLLI